MAADEAYGPVLKDLWIAEVFPRLQSSSLFVMRFINRSFYALLKDHMIPESPVIQFIKNGFLELVRWDQENAAPSRYRCFEGLISKAVKGGHIDTVRYLIVEGIEEPSAKDVLCAIHYQHLEILNYFESLGFSLQSLGGKDLYRAVAENCEQGALEMVRYLVQISPEDPPDWQLLIRAARSKNKDLIEFLSQHGISRSEDFGMLFLAEAIETLYLSWIVWCMKFLELHEFPSEYTNSSYFYPVLDAGRTDIMDYFLQQGFHPTEANWSHFMSRAARGKHVESVRWLVQNGCPNEGIKDLKYFLEDIIRLGDFEVIKLLVDLGAPLRLNTCFNLVVSRKSLEFVEWIETHQCSIDPQSAFSAAITANWEFMARRLYSRFENEIKRPTKVFDTFVVGAVLNADASVLKWLLSLNFPAIQTECIEKSLIRFKECPELFEVLVDALGFDISIKFFALNFPNLGFEAQFRLLECLAENEHILNSDLIWDVLETCFNTISRRAIPLFFKIGLKLDPKYALKAAKENRLELLKFLYRHDVKLDFAKIAKIARKLPSPDIVEWAASLS